MNVIQVPLVSVNLTTPIFEKTVLVIKKKKLNHKSYLAGFYIRYYFS